MKLREHRGLLADSMETVIEIEQTHDALTSSIRDSILDFWNIEKEKIIVKPYGYDDRIKWNTYIVIIEGHGVYGFIDRPLNA
jgi:hypothetical protein